ncbi:5' nucleotidase, NT5C type [Marinisporobacter balticus]|uniref:Nucleotidase n=1 Tax=Marinisporobacter balticus TaxID=2018667 RepID=A0A4V2S9G9_9FIRM|nr:hypothetical protein [Marinisporobacter balticus]TCO67880.1 hypothetical protein EV214_1556 [Marinisporobacter balticus]
MNRLNICVDIDGTLTEPYYWLDKANNYFKTNIEPKHVTQYDIHEVIGICREDYLNFYKQYGEEIHLSAKLRNDARDVLERIEKNNNIYYVTAREARMQDVTNKWFERNDLPNGRLFLLGSHYKVEKAKELNCHIFIEDRYENAIQLALAGFHVLLIDCEYNRQPLIYGITRVFSWKDVYKKIINYSQYKPNKDMEEIA